MTTPDLSMKQTPMFRQYFEAKRACPEALLLFRMGDFYELFFDDARTAAQVLGLSLTSRDKGENGTPMAGFPYHQLDTYIAKLISAGYRAAVCDQMEDPKKAKGLVKREVTRIVTAGTVTEETLLDPKKSNYLAAVCLESQTVSLEVGLAWVELSTGKFYAATVPHQHLYEQVARIAPSEILYSDNETFDADGMADSKIVTTKRPDWTFGFRTAYNTLLKQFKTQTLGGFGFNVGTHQDGTSQKRHDVPAIRAAGAIIEYLNETQRQTSVQIDAIIPYRPGSQLEIDESSRRSLEIARTIREGRRDGSLLAVLDRCMTPMGSRLLAEWVASPLTEITPITARHDAIEQFLDSDGGILHIQEQLRRVHDLQRLMTRILQNRSVPRDLLFIARTLRTLPFFRETLQKFSLPLLRNMGDGIDPLSDLCQTLENAIKEEASTNIREGNFIRDGFHSELDQLRSIQRGGKDWIAKFQAEEIKRTGISTLKVGYTRVFGYYIEVTNVHREKIPGDYIRRQTVKNAERYITPELKEYEEKVLTADERACSLEYAIFEKLREQVCAARQSMQQTATILAELDVLTALASLAKERGYCRPQMTEEPILNIVDGRHPVLDLLEPAGVFVPNDAHLDDKHGVIQLITGPNMSGKSTFIRQNALLCIMAQLGSFLPAKSATIGICDRIFARVGASDELTRGQSTFMVEMTETARILNQATRRSLVILDEIGRGTSTYDGISLAWAIVEYLHEKVKARTLFATHYHELTELSESLPAVKNLNVAVREQRDEIAFLYKILSGSADKSYGIHVARLAGVPKAVISRAQIILNDLEQTHVEATPHLPTTKRSSKRQTASGLQLTLFGLDEHPVVNELRRLNLDNLTPLDALQLLAEWKERL